MVPLRVFVSRLGLVVRSGEDRLDTPVRWVHVSELSDPTRYLQGKELLLLAGTDLRPGQSAGYVTRVKAAGVTALGFGIAPVFDRVPDELVAACRDQGLPLLEVPASVTFESCAELLYAELLSSELSEIRRLSEAQRALIKAVTGPSPITRSLELLAAHTGGWALLYDRVRDRKWCGGQPRVEADVQAAIDRVSASTRPASATMSSADQRVMVCSVAGPLPSGYALAVGAPMVAGVTDQAVVMATAALLGLIVPGPMDEWPSHQVGRAALALALGPRSARWTQHAAAVFGVQSSDALWRLVCARIRDRVPETRIRARLGEFASLLASPFVDQDGAVFLGLIPRSAPLDQVIEDLTHGGWLAGISAAHPMARLGAAHEEAVLALRTALFQGVCVVSGMEVDGLAGTLDMARLRRFADRRFQALRERRPQDAPELLATLRAWLRHNGHWDRAAEEIGVHRNTVRHRIAQVEASLGCRLGDVDTRVELYLALRALEEL